METIFEKQNGVNVAIMQRVSLMLSYPIHPGGLTAALQTVLADKVIGVLASNPSRPVEIFLTLAADLDDETDAITIAMAHDPVFIALDKTVIVADNSDAVTVTITCPRPSPAAVTLEVAYRARNDTLTWQDLTDWPIPLTSGVGSDTLTAQDRGEVALRVKNGGNRSNDVVRLTCR